MSIYIYRERERERELGHWGRVSAHYIMNAKRVIKERRGLFEGKRRVKWRWPSV